MKTVLILAAALGLSTSAALAECAGHAKVTASVEVDREITTASISKSQTPEEQALLLQKQKAAEDKANATE